VLTMRATIDALEQAYADVAAGEAVCRPRIDIRIPTASPAKNYQWGSMEGGSTRGYFAIRMKSDVVYETEYNGAHTQEKYCTRPGLYCGLVLLTSTETGEPLAFINDGVLQHMRVGADGGIGAKYMANRDAITVGMLGSGGMATSNLQAFMEVRKIRRLHVFSPTAEHRETFARKVAEKYGIDVKACGRPEEIYEGADIVAACTDSAIPVLEGKRLEKGAHVINIGGSGIPDAETLNRVDVYLRFGDAPAPASRPDLNFEDEHLGWEARGDKAKHGDGRPERKRGHGILLREKRVTLADVKSGRAPGRTARDQITYSERGNLQGAQFFSVAGAVYELAKAAGLGREIPTEWFLQDIRN
jgi:alanine dehydrogenase